MSMDDYLDFPDKLQQAIDTAVQMMNEGKFDGYTNARGNAIEVGRSFGYDPELIVQVIKTRTQKLGRTVR